MKLLYEDSYALMQFDNEEIELSDVNIALGALDAFNCSVILDFGDAMNDLSRTESLLIALKLAELDRLRFHKIGLIGNNAGCGVSRVAEYARGRGLTVRAFRELEKAAVWIQT